MNRKLCLRRTVASSDKFAFYRSMKEMLQLWLFANGYFVVSEKFYRVQTRIRAGLYVEMKRLSKCLILVILRLSGELSACSVKDLEISS